MLCNLKSIASKYELKLDYRSINNLEATRLLRVLNQDKAEAVASGLLIFLLEQVVVSSRYQQIYNIFEWAYDENS